MTTVIRAARLALEVKTVPVMVPAVDVRKVQIQQPAPSPNASATNAPATAQPQPPPPPSAPAPSPVPTYDEYKQRLAGELAQVSQQAIDAGREQGLQQGRLAAQTEFRQQLDTLRAIIQGAGNAHARYLEEVADEVGEIVFTAVSKILGDGFTNREGAVATVREAVRRSKERGRLLVRVSPEDFELLNARRRELLEGAVAGEVDLLADPKVKLGGCMLEGASGTLDARLELQLQRLREVLTRARLTWSEP
jgi:flagellar assembly protein FliH